MPDEPNITLPFVVEIIGDLPYYVPIPEGVVLTPSLIGAEPFRLKF